MLLQFGAVSAELLKNHLQGVGANPTTLLAFSREELSIVQSTRASSTYQSCRSYHRQLESFVKSKGIADTPLATLTMDFFDDYRIYFKRKGYALSSTKQNLFWLSRLMYRAVSQQTIRYNPFRMPSMNEWSEKFAVWARRMSPVYWLCPCKMNRRNLCGGFLFSPYSQDWLLPM